MNVDKPLRMERGEGEGEREASGRRERHSVQHWTHISYMTTASSMDCIRRAHIQAHTHTHTRYKRYINHTV
jgi:hypothetical protein